MKVARGEAGEDCQDCCGKPAFHPQSSLDAETFVYHNSFSCRYSMIYLYFIMFLEFLFACLCQVSPSAMAINLFWLLCGCHLAPGPHGRQANIQFCQGFLVSMLKFTASHGPQAELLVALAVCVGILVKRRGPKF